MACIRQVEIRMVDLQPNVVRTDAIQSFVSQETPIVSIEDRDGNVGTGYCYTIGVGGHAIISLIAKTLAPCLIGCEAEEIESIGKKLLMLTHATSVGAITSLALAAIDSSLWDLRCKKAGLPLWQLAGGAKNSVPLYSTEGGWLHLPIKTVIEDAMAMKEAGFIGSKIKIGKPSLADDHTRLSELRKAVGKSYQIMVDANQSYNLSEAIRCADMLAENKVSWFEEPLPADDIGTHVMLARHSRVPIAVGESMYSISQFKDYLQRGACSIIQVDVARIGGISAWLKVAHMAEAFNICVCPHFLMELHVSLVCAVPNAPALEYIPQLDSITKSHLTIKQGRAYPPNTPGIGIDWDWDIINSKTLKDTHHIITKP